MSEAPKVLVLVSSGAEASVVTPTLAALQAVGLNLRAYNSGSLGSRSGGAVDWVMRAIGGEVIEQQIQSEIKSFRPDALLCFEAGVARVACALSEQSVRPFPVLAVVADLAPSAAWSQVDVDRYFVVDDEAAVLLEEHGAEANRMVVVGPVVEYQYVEAASADRKTLKKNLGLGNAVVLVEVAGIDLDVCSKLALQLSLVQREVTFLFAAGDDSDVAASLRSQVPLLDMRAKLFGQTEDAANLWRSADVVVTSGGAQSLARAMAVGAKVVCLEPEAGMSSHRANALEMRGCGAIAGNVLMVGTVVEQMLSASCGGMQWVGVDGASRAADAVFVLASQRAELIDERRARESAGRKAAIEDAGEYAAWAVKSAAPAGALEDLGAGPGQRARRAAPPRSPSRAAIARLLAELAERRAQLSRTLADAQAQVAQSERDRCEAEAQGSALGVKTAERSGALERARMHKALSQMAALEKEEKSLKGAAEVARTVPWAGASRVTGGTHSGSGPSASREPIRGSGKPSVAEELERLRRQASSSKAPSRKKSKPRGGAKRRNSGVDDELAALKRKMAAKRKGS